MPIRRMLMKTIDVKRMLELKQTPPKELDISAHIRIMDIKPHREGLSYILLDIIYSTKEHKGDTSVMDARLEIEVLYEDKEDVLSDMYERWDKSQEIRQDVYHKVGNNAFTFSVLTLMPLVEKMQLPPVIPIPTPIPSPKKTMHKAGKV